MVNKALTDAGILLGREVAEHEGFQYLLESSDTAVRIHAYDLLTMSSMTNATLPSGTLQCVLQAMPYLYNDNDAYDRGEILSITRRLLKRVESGLLRSEHGEELGDAKVAQQNHNFLCQMIPVLVFELGPGTSYPRHILALQTLHLLIHPKALTVMNYDYLIHTLFDLTLDPFNDVRALSVDVLKAIMTSDNRAKTAGGTILLSLLPSVNELATRSCRQDHADAAGRLSSIAASGVLDGLSWTASGATSDLQDFCARVACEKLHNYVRDACDLKPGDLFPLHATMLTVVHYLNGISPGSMVLPHSQLCQLVTTCQNLWILVSSELCIDSPERATEEDVGDTDGGPKDLLSYSWRALRDSR